MQTICLSGVAFENLDDPHSLSLSFSLGVLPRGLGDDAERTLPELFGHVEFPRLVFLFENNFTRMC